MSITTRSQVFDAAAALTRLDKLKATEDGAVPAMSAIYVIAGGRQTDLSRDELASVLALLRAPLVDRLKRLGVEVAP